MRIVSCNPAEVQDPDVPPPFSGYPVGDRSAVGRLLGRVRRARTAEMHATFSAFCVERGAPPLPELEFMHESP